jgi:carbon storage regulator
MLILARKVHERIVIGDDIEVSIVDIKGDQVKLGIRAPRHVKVYRQEVYEAIQRENRIAAQRASDTLPSLEGFLDQSERARSRPEDSERSKDS